MIREAEEEEFYADPYPDPLVVKEIQSIHTKKAKYERAKFIQNTSYNQFLEDNAGHYMRDQPLSSWLLLIHPTLGSHIEYKRIATKFSKWTCYIFHVYPSDPRYWSKLFYTEWYYEEIRIKQAPRRIPSLQDMIWTKILHTKLRPIDRRYWLPSMAKQASLKKDGRDVKTPLSLVYQAMHYLLSDVDRAQALLALGNFQDLASMFCLSTQWSCVEHVEHLYADNLQVWQNDVYRLNAERFYHRHVLPTVIAIAQWLTNGRLYPVPSKAGFKYFGSTKGTLFMPRNVPNHGKGPTMPAAVTEKAKRLSIANFNYKHECPVCDTDLQPIPILDVAMRATYDYYPETIEFLIFDFPKKKCTIDKVNKRGPHCYNSFAFIPHDDLLYKLEQQMAFAKAINMDYDDDSSVIMNIDKNYFVRRRVPTEKKHWGFNHYTYCRRIWMLGTMMQELALRLYAWPDVDEDYQAKVCGTKLFSDSLKDCHARYSILCSTFTILQAMITGELSVVQSDWGSRALKYMAQVFVFVNDVSNKHIIVWL